MGTGGSIKIRDKKEFVIIRREGVNCYLVESTSFEVAIEIEGWIQPN